MQFRDLNRQYNHIKSDIDKRIQTVIDSTTFIQGKEVKELEEKLADCVGVKHCVSCANGTDALQLALMAWGIGPGDAVFVPDFTFFSSGEVVSVVGATPIFVDVRKDTFNIDVNSLEYQIQKIKDTGELVPRVVIAVDLFGLPADYEAIKNICLKHELLLLEDGAQGFGGKIGEKRACSFGDISTTSFFPAKPLGCYGDGGAIFTDNDEWAALIRSYCVHGKGDNKYDNVRIGMNSRLDSIQAAVLNAKLPIFINEELDKAQEIANIYTAALADVVRTPVIAKNYYSSWAQYTIQLSDKKERDGLQVYLKEKGIPSMIYYQKPMHRQLAFSNYKYDDKGFTCSKKLADTVLSIPFHPYLTSDEIEYIVEEIKKFHES
ncbi:dTDP-4-amino-4,6-dideoxygalactose transaminase [Butyrivibrio fibrisolvens DSM 3071]|uniref:dTDP-4-amino-4,6-dideoxygalactose transaminase n=1 Tax=Butyrivibrio fibrisolvens DSM 3071 TaxID=1121131 RepID=A0A1M5YYC8_BUTFI|nr:DegT/DnrJ/EryC1/StrS family aminotransferase [Butyrivibrio fibrisolvens]SHI17029.1 dTDP-4-amino-4,6-dideoxygalactose transaminase [Butyrivibrio fibrisolvens DSM 3071]